MLGNFLCFCCRLLTFLNHFFFQKHLSETLSEYQTVCDPDQDRHSVGPNLGHNCLQSLSTDFKSHQLKVQSLSAPVIVHESISVLVHRLVRKRILSYSLNWYLR